MHMPSADARHTILKPGVAQQARHRELLKRLAPERWPLDPSLLPPGTALVGGAVRDALLDRLQACPDLDLVVPDEAIRLCKKLAGQLNGTCVVLDEERDMARLVLKGWTIDLARQEGTSLVDDLWRRDFCLNAIALPLSADADICDPTDGIADLRDGRLRAVRESNLVDDPLRLLRGLRLLAEIPLAMEPTTATWIHRHRRALTNAAPERILNELQRLVCGPWAEAALAQLVQFGLLSPWAAVETSATPMRSTLLSRDEAAVALPLARLTRLVSDTGLERLRASKLQRQRCRRLRYWQRQLGSDPNGLSETKRLQLHEELDEDLPALVLTLPEATQQHWLQRWRDPADPLFHPQSAVDGTTLQRELGVKPGPSLGRLLRHLRQERAYGRIVTEDDAIKEAHLFITRKGSSL